MGEHPPYFYEPPASFYVWPELLGSRKERLPEFEKLIGQVAEQLGVETPSWDARGHFEIQGFSTAEVLEVLDEIDPNWPDRELLYAD